MNFGYLIVISTKSANHDYLKMAYALALSIKNTQKPGYDKVALVTDDINSVNDLKSPWVFDQVIEWKEQTFWDGRSWMDKLSPWESTVCLDADMIFLRDYSHWIDYFVENSDIYIANKVFTYRGELVEDDFYRKTFTKNSLPNFYSMWTFFKKESAIVKEFFSLARYILKYPDEFKNLYLKNHNPKIIGTDESFAISSEILGISDNIGYDLEFPKVVHMKPMIQNWPWPANKWSDHVGFYLNKKGNLKIGNYQQHDIVHYVEKETITDELISILEEIAWKK
jgi:hypothetical protein